MKSRPVPSPHRLEWRPKGDTDWHVGIVYHDPGEATEDHAKKAFHHRVAHSIGEVEMGKLYEARLWRNGTVIAAWDEDGR